MAVQSHLGCRFCNEMTVLMIVVDSTVYKLLSQVIILVAVGSDGSRETMSSFRDVLRQYFHCLALGLKT